MNVPFKRRVVPALVAMVMLCVEPNAVAVDRYVVRVAVQKVPTGWRWVHFGFSNLYQCTKFFLSARTKNANPRIYITQAGWDAMTFEDELQLSTIASMESGAVAVQRGTHCRAHAGASRQCTVDGCIQLKLLPPDPPEEMKEEKEEKEGKRSDREGVRFHGRRDEDQDEDRSDAIEQDRAQGAPVEAPGVRLIPQEEKKGVEPPRENQGAVGPIQQAAALDRPAMPQRPPPPRPQVPVQPQPPQPLPVPEQAADELVDAVLALPSPPQGVNASGLDVARVAVEQRPRIHRPLIGALAGFGKLPVRDR